MITEKKYEYVKSFYQQELDRENKLNQRAQVYLSICSFYLTALLFQFHDLDSILISSGSLTLKVLLCATYILIFFGLLSSIFALNLFKYKLPVSGKELTKEFDNEISDEEFIERRTADFLLANDFNTRRNNKKSYLIRTSLIFIVAANFAAFTFLLRILL